MVEIAQAREVRAKKGFRRWRAAKRRGGFESRIAYPVI
jgi:hypothetical protein